MDMMELSEQDALFNAYLDDELSERERDEFNARLRDDPEFKRAYDGFVGVMQVVRALPFEFAPDDFVDKVQGRIRQRSRGRFFAENFLTQARLPYEVVAVVMMIVMAAVYLLMEAPHDAEIVDVANPSGWQAPADADPRP